MGEKIDSLTTYTQGKDKKDNTTLEWRRSKVIELNSQGYSQPEISRTLQVSLGTINRDLQIIRQEARDNLQKHIQERIPAEYQRCLTGLNQVLKTCWAIANNPHTDDRTKLQATAIINDSYKYIMDLTTNGVIEMDAIKYMNRKVELLNGNGEQEQKKMLDVIQESETETTQSNTNASGVF